MVYPDYFLNGLEVKRIGRAASQSLPRLCSVKTLNTALLSYVGSQIISAGFTDGAVLFLASAVSSEAGFVSSDSAGTSSVAVEPLFLSSLHIVSFY